MYSINDLIKKYDIDDGFKKAVSKLVAKLDKEDTIEILVNMIVDTMYGYSLDYEIRMDDAGNVRIGIEKDLTDFFNELFK